MGNTIGRANAVIVEGLGSAGALESLVTRSYKVVKQPTFIPQDANSIYAKYGLLQPSARTIQDYVDAIGVLARYLKGLSPTDKKCLHKTMGQAVAHQAARISSSEKDTVADSLVPVLSGARVGNRQSVIGAFRTNILAPLKAFCDPLLSKVGPGFSSIMKLKLNERNIMAPHDVACLMFMIIN